MFYFTKGKVIASLILIVTNVFENSSCIIRTKRVRVRVKGQG